MSKPTIFCIAASDAQVAHICDRLKDAGFSNTDVSVVFPEERTRDSVREGTLTGAGAGSVVGGGLGWLAGIGSLALPGVGPVIAAGPLMAAITGAAVGVAVGGVAGGLVSLGLPEAEARSYEERLKSGSILISVHTRSSGDMVRARAIFASSGAEDICLIDEASTARSPTTRNAIQSTKPAHSAIHR